MTGEVIKAKDVEGLADYLAADTLVERRTFIGKLPCGCVADGVIIIPLPDCPMTEEILQQREELYLHEVARCEQNPNAACPKCGADHRRTSVSSSESTKEDVAKLERNRLQ